MSGLSLDLMHVVTTAMSSNQENTVLQQSATTFVSYNLSTSISVIDLILEEDGSNAGVPFMFEHSMIPYSMHVN